MRAINSRSTNQTVVVKGHRLPVAEVAPPLQRSVRAQRPLRFDRRITRLQRFPVEEQMASLPKKTHVGIFLDIRV